MSDLIILCGPYAAGKTTLGKRLSRALERPFFDSDAFLERALYKKEGERAFRKKEYRVLKPLLNYQRGVIATGGGAVVFPDTKALLKKASEVIYLKVDKRILWERWERKGFPHFATTYKDFECYLEERLALYEEVADRVVCANYLEKALEELCGK